MAQRSVRLCQLPFACRVAHKSAKQSFKPLTRPNASSGTDGYAFVDDRKTGVKFPATLRPWVPEMETMRCLGTSCREKAILLFSVKVYAFALYVEGNKATRELGIRGRGGVFADNDNDAFCDALLDGAFAKMIAIQLVRDVDGDTFVAALAEALEPRMSLSGETRLLNDFRSFFLGKDLTSKTNVLLLWQPSSNCLQVKLVKGGSFDMEGPADMELASGSLCRALYEVWMGSNPVVPDAKQAFADGARKLVESDTLSRDQLKPGGRYTPNP